MTEREIIERIMTQHWDIIACNCWVCEEGRRIGCAARAEYLRWKAVYGFVDVAEAK